MDRLSRFVIRWKLVVGVFLPIVLFALTALVADVYVALAAAVVLALTVAVVYVFADYASEAL